MISDTVLNVIVITIPLWVPIIGMVSYSLFFGSPWRKR